MTATATKVTTKWDAKKVAQTTSAIMSATWMSAYEVLSKLDHKALLEFNKLVTEHKLNHYKSLNIKTPLELVKAIAETEHNVFGSEIEIVGDEQKATLKYVSCGMWEASQKHCAKFSQEQQQKMGEMCQESWKHIAEQFGFKFEPKMGKDTFEMTFSK